MCTSASAISSDVVEKQAEVSAQVAWFLNRDVHCCEFDEGAIVLDLRNNAYLGIDAQYLRALRARVGNWPGSEGVEQKAEGCDSPKSENLIRCLAARGILTTSRPCEKPSPAVNATAALTLSTVAVDHGRIPFGHWAQFVVALLTVAICLKRNDLASLLDWLRRRQSSIHRAPAAGISENASKRLKSFLWLRTWCYTAKRRCLFDSLVLSNYLTRGKVPCTLVIGVATKPFLAHAWVQLGESVLNDTAEHVQDFKPILSVGGD